MIGGSFASAYFALVLTCLLLASLSALHGFFLPSSLVFVLFSLIFSLLPPYFPVSIAVHRVLFALSSRNLGRFLFCCIIHFALLSSLFYPAPF